MAPMYYRNSNAALLVFDITQEETFKAVQGWVKGWFNRLGNIEMILVHRNF
jgi:GTPase SAR1 family protein